jgi:hypothetical protein
MIRQVENTDLPDEMFDEVVKAHEKNPHITEAFIDPENTEVLLGEDVTLLASSSSVLTAQLISSVEALGAVRQQLAHLVEKARNMQQELARRGIRMDFDELNAPMLGTTEIHTVGAITPAPGVTESIPEPLEEDEILDEVVPVELQDTRSVAQIRRDATPPANPTDAANFAQQMGADHMKAIEAGMREAAKLQQRSAGL